MRARWVLFTPGGHLIIPMHNHAHKRLSLSNLGPCTTIVKTMAKRQSERPANGSAVETHCGAKSCKIVAVLLSAMPHSLKKHYVGSAVARTRSQRRRHEKNRSAMCGNQCRNVIVWAMCTHPDKKTLRYTIIRTTLFVLFHIPEHIYKITMTDTPNTLWNHQ